MPEDNKIQISCSNCDVSYWIKWKDGDHEPSTCPFCGADTTIDDEEDAIFENEHEQDDWN